MLTFVNSTWTIVDQGAKAARDDRLKPCASWRAGQRDASKMVAHAIKNAAPQALLLAQ